MEFAEEVREFLVECNENLGILDREIVELEKSPTDQKLIASVFRVIHTIKGTSGFFGFETLGTITHVAENILAQVRERQRSLTPEVVSLILETVDAVKRVLANIEECNEEGEDVYEDLKRRLEDAYRLCPETLPEAGEGAASVVPVVMMACAEELGLKASSDSDRLDKRHHEQVKRGVAPQPAVAERDRRPSKSNRQRKTSTADIPASGSTIRVDVHLLDKLMNLVGELVLARNQILQEGRGTSTNHGASQRLNLIAGELQEGVMRARMQPIGVVWNKLPRVVRDLASAMGKRIEIQMEGAETELDKTIIEAIKDPLTHIVRNCCDHGIEAPDVRVAKGKNRSGTIALRAYHEGGHVHIEVSDDGAGIDPERIKSKAVEKGLVRVEQTWPMSEWEALRLLFLPGFSTAEKITSISGRGVGMDVVKTNIESIGGAVDLFNRPALDGAAGGTAVRVKIPLTLAIIPGLIVGVGDACAMSGAAQPKEDRFVIPQANLLELVRLEGADGRRRIETIHGAQLYRRRGGLLPLVRLTTLLELDRARVDNDVLNIVVVQAEETAFGLIVDSIQDTQEIVVKALSKQLQSLSCYLGATVMGDGTIALILDVPGLARAAGMLTRSPEMAAGGAKITEEHREPAQMFLLFSAGRFARLAVALAMVARIEEISRSRIEYAGGRPVLHYCGSILPLVSIGAGLDANALDPIMDQDRLQVIVLHEGERCVGLVVNQVNDIVTESPTVCGAHATTGISGSGVVGGKVTDFVNVQALLDAAGGDRPDGSSVAASSGIFLPVGSPDSLHAAAPMSEIRSR